MLVQERTAIRERRYPVVATTVTPAMREQTRALARERNVTPSVVLREAIAEYLARQTNATATGRMA